MPVVANIYHEQPVLYDVGRTVDHHKEVDTIQQLLRKCQCRVLRVDYLVEFLRAQ